MLERKVDQVSVVSRSSSARRSMERLAGQLGLRTGAPGDRAVGPGSASGAVLFHLAGPSESALRELREVVRNAFPSPVVVLTSGPEDEVRRRALGAGAAEVIRLEPDETRTEAALAGVLARLRGPGSAPCPRCPVAGAGDGAPACLMGGSEGAGDGRPDAEVAEDGHWRCFPFLATSPAMLRAEEVARKAARADATVLIHGESGSGKEVLARYIHWTGPRSRGPFVKVNCAALPDNLLESELFGYEKGAFTGAETRKPGRFELARGGVILLDEVAEMSLGLQAKLLQVLQERRFTPLGGVRELEVDVQILATTNKDLEQEVADGRFRRDLYFRLRVIDLPVPPLRERPEDVPVLARYFVCRFSTQYGQCAPELDPAALARLSRAPWPGNVRELENLMRRFVILGEEDVLLGPTPSARDHPTASAEATPSPTAEPLTLRAVAQRAMRAAEREAILAALERTRWNRTQAARVLGVSYKTLLTKMKQLLD